MTKARTSHVSTVYAYARCSTEEQAVSGLGLDAQRAALAAWSLGRQVEPVYVTDAAVSGSTPPHRRPSLGPILAGIHRGDVLVAAKLDRLGRSTLDVVALAELADAAGWTLVVLDLNLDTSTPIGRLVLTVLAGVAEMERRLIGERTRVALAAKKAAGHRMGRPVELAAEVRERIGRDRAAGVSLAGIVDALTAEGVPTARGGRWTRSAVQKVVRSLALDAHAEARRAAVEVAA